MGFFNYEPDLERQYRGEQPKGRCVECGDQLDDDWKQTGLGRICSACNEKRQPVAVEELVEQK